MKFEFEVLQQGESKQGSRNRFLFDVLSSGFGSLFEMDHLFGVVIKLRPAICHGKGWPSIVDGVELDKLHKT